MSPPKLNTPWLRKKTHTAVLAIGGRKTQNRPTPRPEVVGDVSKHQSRIFDLRLRVVNRQLIASLNFQLRKFFFVSVRFRNGCVHSSGFSLGSKNNPCLLEGRERNESPEVEYLNRPRSVTRTEILRQTAADQVVHVNDAGDCLVVVHDWQGRNLFTFHHVECHRGKFAGLNRRGTLGHVQRHRFP